jgi:hypothetical protein
MKTLFILLLALISASSMAQGPTDFGNDSIYGKNLSQAKMYQLRIDNYKSMKNTGLILLVAGIPCTLTGIAFLIVGIRNENNGTSNLSTYWASYDKGYNQKTAGYAIGGVGVGMMVSGLVLHVVGVRKTKEYQLKRDGLKIHPYTNLKSTGLTLTYRF